MKKVIILILIVLAGCKKEEPTGVNQTWLDTTIADLEKSELKQYFYIVKGDYEGRCVTYVNNCCPMCMTTIIVYDCDGNKLENADPARITNHTVIWKPDNFSCQLN